MKQVILFSLLLVFGFIIIFIFGRPKQNSIKITPQTVSKKITPTQKPLTVPSIIIDKEKVYTANISTSMGDIEISLDTQNTPITANNFISLAKQSFYNNVIFHRVIRDFMIQTGDPKGDGTGGPGYQFDDEKIVGEYVRGTIAMANAGPNTNGSQFFIMHKTNKELPKNYVIFGRVIKGLDVVDKIANTKVKANSQGELSSPITPILITSIKIIEK